MPRKTTSQWDFGELFPPEQTRRVLTVSELTLQVKRLLEAQIGSVWVSGEVSNLRVQASGHAYFTLKDAGAQLACVLFRGAAPTQRELLADGRKVLLQGDLTVYEPRGQYQLVVTAVELHGVGALQLALERLKQKLAAEGLFASERKRPLPAHPERIGLVTSPTGAALRDVLYVIQRRQPSLEIVLAPCRVQGDGAAAEIAGAIRRLNVFNAVMSAAALSGLRPPASGPPVSGPQQPTSPAPARSYLDLILVTRGGGSLEDLWAFNEEVVARAIFESALPVVSAVGHEIDFTISDFVADCRAATPSAAAELITAGAVAARDWLTVARARLPRLARDQHEAWAAAREDLRARIRRAHPRQRVNEAWQRLDDLRASLGRATRYTVRAARARWETAQAAWQRLHPAACLDGLKTEVNRAGARLRELARHRLEQSRERLAALGDRLRLLSPELTLARGYSITMDAETGRVLRDAEQTQSGQRLRTRLHAGELRSVVE
jgi:exodeoxyribonuclease VII large subunit